MTNNKSSDRYYVAVRPQTNETHSVHREGCPFMPDDSKRIYLGMFLSGDDARHEGRKYYNSSSGCRFCTHRAPSEIREPAMAEVDSHFALYEKRNASGSLSPMYSFMN